MNAIRAVTVVAVLALTACAAPLQQVIEEDRTMASLKVLSMEPTELGHSVFNNPVGYLGLTGAIVAGSTDRSRANALREHIGELDIPAAFQHYLDEALAERGLPYSWADPRVATAPRRSDGAPRPDERDSYGLRRIYAGSETAGQAQLDLAIQFAGYASDGVGENNPYRPTVMVNVRLVGPDGRRVMYQNGVHYNPVNAGEGAVEIEAAPGHDYATFQDLRDEDPVRLRTALLDALRAVAYRVAAEL